MEKNVELIRINGKYVRKIEQHKTESEYYKNKKQVFIIGSKGIPASYGGFETFVDKLTEYQHSSELTYHVSRLASDDMRYEYNGAICFSVNAPEIGPAKAIYYDLASLKFCINYCKEHLTIKRPVFYVLACRIGPFIGHLKKEIEKLGGVLYVNPDGHEWKRPKWSYPIRRYWKISERLMVKHADLLICDSKNIEEYIKKDYKKYNPNTKFIAYGSDTKPSVLKDDDDSFVQWLLKHGLTPKEYYLVVGRFVPENNFETMIREFLNSNSQKNLAIITTTNDAFLEKLEKKLHFKKDSRIKFVGTVYDQELLKKIRENAYAYLHGHEVGGTNPSLLEALGSTKLNLLLDVGFNKEVAKDVALYWNKDSGNLADLIKTSDNMTEEQIQEFGNKAKARIREAYTWDHIVDLYEDIFLNT